MKEHTFFDGEVVAHNFYREYRELARVFGPAFRWIFYNLTENAAGRAIYSNHYLGDEKIKELPSAEMRSTALIERAIQRLRVLRDEGLNICALLDFIASKKSSNPNQHSQDLQTATDSLIGKLLDENEANFSHEKERYLREHNALNSLS